MASHAPPDVFSPTTTQLLRVVHASALALTGNAIVRHSRPNVEVRTTSDVVVVSARPTHDVPVQCSEPRPNQVDGVVRAVHVTPASWVTSTSRVPAPLTALTMHVNASLHETPFTVSARVHASGVGVDHVTPPSLVNEIAERLAEVFADPFVDVTLTIAAHELVAKQSSARTPSLGAG